MVLKFLIYLCLFLQIFANANCDCVHDEKYQADEAFSYITVFGSNETKYPIYPTDEENFNKQCR